MPAYEQMDIEGVYDYSLDKGGVQTVPSNMF